MFLKGILLVLVLLVLERICQIQGPGLKTVIETVRISIKNICLLSSLQILLKPKSLTKINTDGGKEKVIIHPWFCKWKLGSLLVSRHPSTGTGVTSGRGRVFSFCDETKFFF